MKQEKLDAQEKLNGLNREIAILNFKLQRLQEKRISFEAKKLIIEFEADRLFDIINSKD
jgi:hypothetical protein